MQVPEILYGVGALALLAALVYGTMQYHNRSKALDAVGERKAQELSSRDDRS
jgi:hypothetical protein